MVHLGDRCLERHKLVGVGVSPRTVKGEWVCSARVSGGTCHDCDRKGYKNKKMYRKSFAEGSYAWSTIKRSETLK